MLTVKFGTRRGNNWPLWENSGFGTAEYCKLVMPNLLSEMSFKTSTFF